VLYSFAQNFCVAVQHDPAQPGPILVVPVDDYCDRGILRNIPQALQRCAGKPLRLFVDGDVQRTVQDRKAHRHDMRNCAPIGSGEMSDALTRQELVLAVRQHDRPQTAIPPDGASAGCPLRHTYP
jgi:hypothetical protein